MPRRHHRRAAPAVPFSRAAGGAVEDGPPWDPDPHQVRRIPPARAGKAYRCPACDQLIAPGVAHVVAWPDRPGGDDERRHWHTGCWSGRGTRGLTRRWS